MNACGVTDLEMGIAWFSGRANGCHVAHARVRRGERLLLLLLLLLLTAAGVAGTVGGSGGGGAGGGGRGRHAAARQHLFGDWQRLKIIGIAAAAADAAAADARVRAQVGRGGMGGVAVKMRRDFLDWGARFIRYYTKGIRGEFAK